MDFFFPVIEMSLRLEFVVFVGFMVGILSGLFGIGGSIMVISFMLSIGISYSIIFTTALMQTISSSVASALINIKNQNINYRILKKILYGSIFGNLLYFLIDTKVHKLSNIDSMMIIVYLLTLLMIFFITIYAIILDFIKNKKSSDFVEPKYISGKKLTVSGTIVGILSSFTGLGGGFIMMPILINIMKIEKKYLSGVISCYTLINAALILFYKIIFYDNNIDILFMAIISIGSIVGVKIGNAVNRRSDKRIINILFLIMITLIVISTLKTFLKKPKDSILVYRLN